MSSYTTQEYFHKLENILLSSSQVLQKQFRTRWKKNTGETWESTEEQGKKFVDGEGKGVFKDATKSQKTMIKRGCLNEWELTTVAEALQNLGTSKEYKNENEAARTLSRLWRELTRLPTKKLYKKEYNRRIEMFRASLLALQVPDEEVQMMEDKAGVTPPKVALESFKKLIEEGEEALKSNEFAKALELYQKATLIPSLLPFHQGIAYEKCSTCNLQLSDKAKQEENNCETMEYLLQAYLDAKVASNLNEMSWQAQHLIAQCFQRGKDRENAIYHLKSALDISPTEKKVKTDLDSCKVLSDSQDIPGNDSHVFPFMAQITISKILNLVQSGTEKKLTEEKYNKLRDTLKDHVFQGRIYAARETESNTEDLRNMSSYTPKDYFHKLENILLGSAQVLQQQFRTRWKKNTGETWESTEEQGKKFVDGEGKSVFKDATKSQKTMIKRGCLNEWELTTVAEALQNLGTSKEYKNENEAARTLSRLWRELNRLPTQKLYKKEYNRRIEMFRASLLALQVPDEEVQMMEDKAGVTPPKVALESFKKLIEEGEEALKSNEFAKALELYQKATLIPSLLSFHQGIAYEKCSTCNLQLSDKAKQEENNCETMEYLLQAYLDAKVAANINKTSCAAQHLIAQCFQRGNDSENATYHLQSALDISPTAKEVKIDLDSCKALSESQDIQDNDKIIDSHDLPFIAYVKAPEILKLFQTGTGKKLAEEEHIKLKDTLNEHVFKGRDYTIIGEALESGLSGIKTDSAEAVRHYAKASHAKYADGIRYLGLCYQLGNGIKKDYKKAFNLILEAAQMPAYVTIPGIPNFKAVNDGVSRAQYYLGTFYADGVMTEKDHQKAAAWFKKSIENGNVEKESVYLLGLLYIAGQGLEKNWKTAEMYFKEGVKLGIPGASRVLITYYIDQLEVEKGKEVFKIWSEFKFDGLIKYFFEALLKSGALLRQKYEDQVLAYEKENQLETNEMTFLERLHRYSIATSDEECKCALAYKQTKIYDNLH
ncbi:unnamed protein product [Orchesella dallaii]|uniref:Uncharacterized protein n=1 Tax=Orchesella dallaii TaxID=48710 RepID=A0ABP1RN57_9HEXA